MSCGNMPLPVFVRCPKDAVVMSTETKNWLAPPEFYFQATFEIPFRDKLEQTVRQGKHFNDLPALPDLACFPQQAGTPPVIAVAWNDEGIGLDLTIRGKSYPWPENHKQKSAKSDLFSFFLDTRDMKSNRRPNRFCHLLELTPYRQAPWGMRPSIIAMNQLSRADEEILEDIPVHFSHNEKSFRVSLWISRELLAGYDPENVPRLGFYYILEDQLLGNATWGLPLEYNNGYDPSLWPSLLLVR